MNTIQGLGDIVAAVAKPIARGIDAVAGTDLENCEDCEDRRRKFNEFLSFGSKDQEPPSPANPTIISPCMGCGRK